MRKVTVNNITETNILAAELASFARAGDIFTLRGNLGAGKTAFAKAFINSLLESPQDVISPTFNLLQTYDSAKGDEIWHYDLYRLKNQDEIYDLAIEDAFNAHIVIIEWPEIIDDILPSDATNIKIEPGENDNQRIITIWRNNE